MRIRRLQLDVEFEYSSMHVFYTEHVVENEPHTIISMNGKEFEGKVEYYEEGDTYTIKIKRIRAY